MPTLIDSTYLNGKLSLPQKTFASVSNRIIWYIDDLEKKFLQELMGYELWKAFDAGHVGTPKYTEMKTGKEYTNPAGKLVKWDGLIRVTGSSKKSPIANYVYYHILSDNYTQTTASGEKKTDSENSVEAHPKLKLSQAWNEMVMMNWEFVQFMEDHPEDYPEFLDHYGCSKLENLLSRVPHTY